MVLGGRPAGWNGGAYVDVDNQGGARQAVMHLLERGRRVVATIAGPGDMVAGRDRLAGYSAALEEAGLTVDSALVGHGDFSQNGGELAMRSLLDKRPDIDACLRCQRPDGRRCAASAARCRPPGPDDVAVVGFDDSPLAELTDPPLTTVHQSAEQMGREMARLLVEQIKQGGPIGGLLVAVDSPGGPRNQLGAVSASRYRCQVMDRLAPLTGRVRISYPENLPVSQRKDDIAAAIRDHQVVIVAGETGSGKTTQLPKICLELGRGADGQAIGHTQPRRIAARTVAERIAEELGTDLGDVVGYKVRFTDRSSNRTQVKVMTDGILLAEIQRDRELRRYDTIIIDEAHERSLNIDFILGYLKQLLPRRPDLKVIITSATIDPERFAEHFGGAPIIEVSGRTYPVEVRYRELTDDQTKGIVDAVQRADRPRDPATSSCSCPGSGRSATPPMRWARSGCGDRATSSTYCRCSPGCRRPSSIESSPRTRNGASCWRPTSQRRR